MRFYLGTHIPSWLSRTEAPLFLSRAPLKRLVSFRRAQGPWSLDSGGFTEIETHGRWTVSPADYAREVRLWQREIGNLDFSAPQDWMCEPPILLRSLLADGYVDGVRERRKGEEVLAYRKYLTKKAEEFPVELLRQRVCVHQNRTIENLISLRELAPEVPWMPVLQGWFPEDYVAHAEAYARAGIDLRKEPVVGLGSVCRRERLDDARKVISKLAGPSWRLRLHGFGLKTDGFKDPVIAAGLVSADSLAWSLGASLRRRQGRKCSVQHRGGCGNCIHWALEWRERTLNVWEETMRDAEQRRPGGRRRRVAANPDEWEDLPPMFVTPTPAPARSSELPDLPPTFAPAEAYLPVVVPSEPVAAEGLRFPAYQSELLRSGIPIGLAQQPGVDARRDAERLADALREIAGSGDTRLQYLVDTGVVGDVLYLPEYAAAEVLHAAALRVAGDTLKPWGLRCGALDLLKRLESATGIHPLQGLHQIARTSGISMLQLWREAKGGGGELAPCQPFSVNVRERRVLVKLLADDLSTAWMKPIVDSFPKKFQEFYSDAWRHADEEFYEIPETPDDEAWMRHGFALQHAWYAFAEILSRAGAEACVTDRSVCGCGDPAHNIIVFRRPGESGWYELGVPYWIWEDPPMTGHVNVEFCRNFAAGLDEIADNQWGLNAYKGLSEEEWHSLCFGHDEDDWGGTRYDTGEDE